MNSPKGILKTCSRGHQFYKSSDCPVCPVCAEYEREQNQADFPKIGAPALRALVNANITNLAAVSNYSEKELLSLHGMGPKAIGILRNALKDNSLSFKE